ncbi:MAG: 5'/3'-nucleotidase SurE [Gemmataceae bacterium]|nr:5'/3'-nucleotidase SurE [Gemmataceae bacterium]
MSAAGRGAAPHFLLTNDDGIDAPGLAALAEAAAELGPCSWVAPRLVQSGCSHRVTTEGPLRVQQHGERRWAVDGTPADCVRLGLSRLTQGVTWVLSGINHGGNLGADVHHSGTVAAAREAALHGLPGIAVSQYRRRGAAIDWRRAVAWLRPLLRDLLNRPWKPGTFWNINLPHLLEPAHEPNIVFCPLDLNPLPLSYSEADGQLLYSGNYHERARQAGSDVDVCFQGGIAVTLLSVV